jgi:hypothetical protein
MGMVRNLDTPSRVAGSHIRETSQARRVRLRKFQRKRRVFGWLQAPQPKFSFLSATSSNPAIIRIDNSWRRDSHYSDRVSDRLRLLRLEICV